MGANQQAQREAAAHAQMQKSTLEADFQGDYIVTGPGFEAFYTDDSDQIQTIKKGRNEAWNGVDEHPYPGLLGERMGMVCACGAEFTDDANFCRKCGAQRQQVQTLNALETEEMSIMDLLRHLEHAVPAAVGAANQADANARNAQAQSERMEQMAREAEAKAKRARDAIEERLRMISQAAKDAQAAAQEAQALARKLTADYDRAGPAAEAIAKQLEELKDALSKANKKAADSEGKVDEFAKNIPEGLVNYDHNAERQLLSMIQDQSAKVEDLGRAAKEAQARADRLAQEWKNAQQVLAQMRGDPVLAAAEASRRLQAQRQELDALAREAQNDRDLANRLAHELALLGPRVAQALDDARKLLQLLLQTQRDAQDLTTKATDALLERERCLAAMGPSELYLQNEMSEAQRLLAEANRAKEAYLAAKKLAEQHAAYARELENRLARAREQEEKLRPTTCHCGQPFVADANFCRLCGRPRMQGWAWDGVKPAGSDLASLDMFGGAACYDPNTQMSSVKSGEPVELPMPAAKLDPSPYVGGMPVVMV